MTAAPDARKRLQVVIPSSATHWMLTRVVASEGGERPKRKKMRGEPDENGQVPDTWPVSEFSLAGVLDAWGDGRYRVDWYAQDGGRLGGEMFEVAEPRPKTGGSRLRSPTRTRPADEEAAATAAAPAGGPSHFGMFEVMALLEKTSERAERRAEMKAEADRQFFLQMQNSQTAMMSALISRAPAEPSGGASADLLRRELRLETEQRIFALRQELGAGNPQPEDDPDDGDDERDPPQDIGEAGERIMVAFLSQLEGAAPAMVQELVPVLMKALASKGIEPTPELRARIEQAQRVANGAHAHGR